MDWENLVMMWLLGVGVLGLLIGTDFFGLLNRWSKSPKEPFIK